MSENEPSPPSADTMARQNESLEAGAGLAGISAAIGAVEGILASGRALGNRQQSVAAAFQTQKESAAQQCQSALAPAQSDLEDLQRQLANASADLSAAKETKRRSANAAAAADSLQRARAGIPAASAETRDSPTMVDPDLAQRMRRLILSELKPAPFTLPADSKVELRQVEDWAGSNWEASNADQPTATVPIQAAVPAETSQHPHTSFDSWFESTGHTPARVKPTSPNEPAADNSDAIDQFQKQWQAWRKQVEGTNSSS